jgi:hypothetical protein
MALSLDTTLYLAAGGTATIGDCAVGDRIMGADGDPATITAKSGIFHTPMYELVLRDGRRLKVCDDHLNQVRLKRFNSNSAIAPTYTEATLTTRALLSATLIWMDSRGLKRPLVWIENCRALEFPENRDILIDPYTVGLLLGDGSMNGKATGQVPVVLTAHEDDWAIYEKEIPYPFGKEYRDKRRPSTITRTILGINIFVSMHGLSSHGNDKKVPEEFLYGSVAQRLALLQGLMDSDGTVSPDGKAFFGSNSRHLIADVMFLVRSLGGQASWNSTGRTGGHKAYLRMEQQMFRLPRKQARHRPLRRWMQPILAINPIPDEPSQCIALDNAHQQFAAGEFVRTHDSSYRW